MDATLPTQATPWIIGAIGGGLALFERLRNIKLTGASLVTAAKDELIKVEKAEKEAWKERYDALNAQYLGYREETHKKTEADNSRLLLLQEEVGSLRAKTDMSPVLKILEEQAASFAESREAQSKINAEVLKGLQTLSLGLEEFRERRRREPHHHSQQQQNRPHED